MPRISFSPPWIRPLRKLEIADKQHVILADTVGFIRHLPHDLVAAFRATLIETCEADLILHVVDASDESRDEKIQAVNSVLREVGAEAVPQLLVYNKIDLQGTDPGCDLEGDEAWRVWLSARDGNGFDILLAVLRDRFCEQSQLCELVLQASEGQVRAFLFESGAIESENYAANGDMHLKIRLSPTLLQQLNRRFEISEDRFEMLADSLAGAA